MTSRLLVLAAALAAACSPALANARASSWCEVGAKVVVTGGVNASSPKVQASYPTCSVTVYLAGTVTKATLYSDNLASPTSLANPFNASNLGYWFFYAANGRYDVQISGGGLATPFTFGDITLLDGYSVTDYGVVCDGNPSTTAGTDNTTTFQNAINNLQVGQTLAIPGGYCNVKGQLSFNGLTGITVKGSDSLNSVIQYVGTSNTTKSVFSLLGAKYVTVKDLHISTEQVSATPPKTIVTLGRISSAAYGNHLFKRVSITGYATAAAVYSIASEECSWEDVYVNLNGGGARFAVYTSQADDLSVGTYTSASNLSQWWRALHLLSLNGAANSAGFYIDAKGGSGDIWITDSYLGLTSGEGTGISVTNHTASNGLGPFGFRSIRMEGANYGFFMDGDNTTANLRGLVIENCTVDNPGVSFMDTTTSGNLISARIVNNRSSTEPVMHFFGNVTGSYLNDATISYVFESGSTVLDTTVINNSSVVSPVFSGTTTNVIYLSPGNASFMPSLILAPNTASTGNVLEVGGNARIYDTTGTSTLTVQIGGSQSGKAFQIMRNDGTTFVDVFDGDNNGNFHMLGTAPNFLLQPGNGSTGAKVTADSNYAYYEGLGLPVRILTNVGGSGGVFEFMDNGHMLINVAPVGDVSGVFLNVGGDIIVTGLATGSVHKACVSAVGKLVSGGC
jgi:hypothetical protein